MHTNHSISLVALLQDSWSCLPLVMTCLEPPKVPLRLFNYRATQTSKNLSPPLAHPLMRLVTKLNLEIPCTFVTY